VRLSGQPLRRDSPEPKRESTRLLRARLPFGARGDRGARLVADAVTWRKTRVAGILSTGTWRVTGLLEFPLLRRWQRKLHSHPHPEIQSQFQKKALKTQGR
jgi:hypothetical protein